MYTNETRHKYTEPVHSTQEQTAGIPEIYIIELVSNFPVTDRRIELEALCESHRDRKRGEKCLLRTAGRFAFLERQGTGKANKKSKLYEQIHLLTLRNTGWFQACLPI